MGGMVNVAIRFASGETICQGRWTNTMPYWFRHPKMFEGDEEHIRNYLALTADNDFIADPYAPGRPSQVVNGEYGLIVWDYVTQTILDNNGYSSPVIFDAIYAGSEKRSEEFVRMAEAGRLMMEIMTKGPNGWKDATRDMTGVLSPEDALRLGQLAYEESRRHSPENTRHVRFIVDPRPMTYVSFRDGNTKGMRQRLAQIGFPMTKKDGLNAILPATPKKREITDHERLARELFRDWKGSEAGKAFKGKTYDAIDPETRQRVLNAATNLMADPEKLQSYRIACLMGGAIVELV